MRCSSSADGRAAEGHARHRRRVVVVAVRELAHAPHHRGHGGPDGDLLVLDQLQRLGRLELALGDHQLRRRRSCRPRGSSGSPTRGRAARSAGRRSGHRRPRAAASGVDHPARDRVVDRVLEVGDHVAVRRDGALRPAGRAARVEDDRVVALVDRLRRGTSARRSRGELVEAVEPGIARRSRPGRRRRGTRPRGRGARRGARRCARSGPGRRPGPWRRSPGGRR